MSSAPMGKVSVPMAILVASLPQESMAAVLNQMLCAVLTASTVVQTATNAMSVMELVR